MSARMSGALGWLDLGDGGKVWYDGLKINTAQPEAAVYCAAKPGPECVPDPG